MHPGHWPAVQALMTVMLLACSGRVILAGDAGADGFQPPQTQTWSITFGGDRDEWMRAVRETPDGGYIAAGWTSSFGEGDRDCFILRLSAQGDVLWQRSYGGPGRDEPRQIIPAAGGGFVVAGFTTSWGSGASDAWVFKIDPDGNLLWQKALGSTGNDTLEAVQEAPGGGILAAGGADASGTGSEALWVFLLGADGSVEWQKTYQLAPSNQAFAMDRTSAGGFIVAAQVARSGIENPDVWVLSIDASGDIAWQNTYGGSGRDQATATAQTTDGGYVVAGSSDSFGDGDQDAWVLKLDGAGAVQWQNVYDAGPVDWIEAAASSPDGGALVAGGTGESVYGPWSTWIFKLDSAGSIVWQKVYRGNAGGYALDLRPALDGGYVAASWTLSSYTWYDAWIIKTTDGGDILGDCPAGLVAESTAQSRPSTAAALSAAISLSAGGMQALDTPAAAAATSLTARRDCP